MGARSWLGTAPTSSMLRLVRGALLLGCRLVRRSPAASRQLCARRLDLLLLLLLLARDEFKEGELALRLGDMRRSVASFILKLRVAASRQEDLGDGCGGDHAGARL